MKKQSMITYVILSFCAVALLGCNSPRYQGRTLSSWTHDLEHEDSYKRSQACQAIGAMGVKAESAIPDLIKRFADDNEGVQDFAADALASIGAPAVGKLEPLLTHSEPTQRLLAATALTKIDPQHDKAQVVLVETLIGVGNRPLAMRAESAVVKVGAPMVPKLIEKLSDPYVPVRLQVVKTLGQLEKKASPAAIEPLAKISSEDKEWEIRKSALQALAKIGTREQVEGYITKALEDPDEGIQRVAGGLLQFIGTRKGASGYADSEDETSKEQAKN